MSIKCKDVQYVIDLVQQTGNSIKEIQKGWSEIDEVIVMTKGLKSDIKDFVQQTYPELEYWHYEGSLMDPPDEGFVCRECSVLISFPK